MLNVFVSSSPPTQVLWKKFPTPFGVERIIALPPVDSVDCADTHISSILSINAASSNTNSDSASERPASPAAEVALICEPFEYLKDSLLSSTVVCFNHDGKY